jgi:hypothetical protein
MKKVRNSFLLILAAVLTLASCKKEELTAPTPTTQPNEVAESRSGGGLVPAPVYTLTKHDNDSLTYYNDGRLAKVQHNAFTYTQYNYGFNTITAKTFSGNQLEKEVTYQIDAQTGRVFESHSKAMTYYSIGNVVNEKWHKYEYDAEGHLKKKYNKYKPNERASFSWGEDGNLVTIYFRDEYNEILYHLRYTRAAETDKLKLQPQRSGLDPYLKIFGKGSKNMIVYEQRFQPGEQNPDIFEHFTHLYNADGYPTSCTVTNANTNKRIDSYSFSYSVTQ